MRRNIITRRSQTPIERSTLMAKSLHKGQTPRSGVRLVLQLEYAINRFFADFRKVPVDSGYAPWFVERVRGYPHTFSRFVLAARS